MGLRELKEFYPKSPIAMYALLKKRHLHALDIPFSRSLSLVLSWFLSHGHSTNPCSAVAQIILKTPASLKLHQLIIRSFYIYEWKKEISCLGMNIQQSTKLRKKIWSVIIKMYILNTCIIFSCNRYWLFFLIDKNIFTNIF